MLKIIRMLNLIKKVITKILNLKLLIPLEYQNAKIFLRKVTLSNWSEEVFVIKKVKNIVPWTYVISVLNGKEIVETFY